MLCDLFIVGDLFVLCDLFIVGDLFVLCDLFIVGDLFVLCDLFIVGDLFVLCDLCLKLVTCLCSVTSGWWPLCGVRHLHDIACHV